MKWRRKKIMLSMVFVLFVFNLWQWWPNSEQVNLKSNQLITGLVSADDLRLFGHEIDAMDIRKIHRDLFVIDKSNIKSSQINKNPVRIKNKKITAKDNAQAVKNRNNKSGLNQFRLMAVLFKNGEKYAHLLRGDKDYSVKKR